MIDIATYKRIAKVDLKIPPKVSPEARDVITRVRTIPGSGFSVSDNAFLLAIAIRPRETASIK